MLRNWLPSIFASRPRTRKRMPTALLVEALEARVVLAADIDNGIVRLGVYDLGSLDANATQTPTNSSNGNSFVSIRYMPTNNEGNSVAPEEGWSIGDSNTSTWGGLYDTFATSVNGISFTSTADSAVSTVDVASIFEVTHDFHPSTNANAYEITVTIRNTTGNAAHAVYLRGMAWDVEPTEFDEYLTIQGATLPNVLYFGNCGSDVDIDPFASRSGNGDVVNFGPGDNGMTVILDLGTLAAGASTSFNLYYGVAADRTAAVTAITSLGLAGYNLASPSSSPGTDGSPNTFFFGFNPSAVHAVNVNPTTIAVAEAGATASYSVVLASQPTASVVVNVATDSQVSAGPTTLTFTTANWNVPQLVTVTAVDDQVVEGVHTSTITHTSVSSDPLYNGLPVSSVTVSITDNDIPSIRLTPASGKIALVEGASQTYTAVLTAAPTSNVTLTMATNSQLSLAPSSLVFTPTDWLVPHVVNVTAVDNTVADGSRTVVITHTTSSANPAFDGIVGPTMSVFIGDNDNSLIVKGTNTADQIKVLFSPSVIQVILNKVSSFYPANYSQVLVLAGAGANTIQLVEPLLPVTVVGGSGVDKVTLDGHPTSNIFSVDDFLVNYNGIDIALLGVEGLQLNGKGANDSFAMLTIPQFATVIQGSGGTDSISAPDRVNSWKITGAGAGTLDTTVSFAFVENLTGGVEADSFWIGAGKSIGIVDGGGGSNALDYSNWSTPVTANLQTGVANGVKGFVNLSSFLGGKGSDKLIGTNQTNTWSITGANAGNVAGTTFQGFENLTGGSQNDTFVFATGQSVKGRIDGGGGTDVLDLSAQLAALTVNLQLKTATFTGGWLNLESFLGGSGVDKLIAANVVNTWSLVTPGAGTVNTATTFQNFENLTGGSFTDVFNVATGAEWLGTLEGAAGLDTINGPAGRIYILTGLNTGTMNSRPFKSIEVRN